MHPVLVGHCILSLRPVKMLTRAISAEICSRCSRKRFLQSILSVEGSNAGACMIPSTTSVTVSSVGGNILVICTILRRTRIGLRQYSLLYANNRLGSWGKGWMSNLMGFAIVWVSIFEGHDHKRVVRDKS
ncbi:hypothetical protein CPB86DRAFT_305802 [Serendipita vermifera]|nr:hypothetical protein CPB86DRAFT_305802 [Serendipita vermifera]